MTVTGFILSGVFSDIPGTVAEEAMLCDFAVKTLYDNEVKNVEIADGGSLFDRMSQLNDNEDGAFVCLSLDAAVSQEENPASDFCVRENVRFITEAGEFLGAFVTKPMDIDEMKVIEKTRVLRGEKINPGSFGRVQAMRKSAVYAALCKEGVYVESIDGACISPLAEIGAGSFIGNGAHISGKCRIGKNCRILGASRISRSDIGDGTSVISGVITDSVIGKNVSVGPFAYVRPGSSVGDSVKVGDFVEIKNSVIGSGTKISHLTYVGDSDVGGGVNFGCGTVTVNYDGIKKHRTIIGDHAFIGCNTNLVAPVEVGENAFIAAGSTITDRIPPKSFAIARQRQTTKENYVTEKMPDMIKK